ncbi:MAG: TolC family protein [Phycisphaerae bacterium]|nr:TolC family protein [Phycisphaerae bacterium]
MVPRRLKQPLRLLPGVIALAAITGCTRYEPRPLDPAAHAREFLGRVPDAPGVNAFADRLREPGTAPVAEFDPADGLTMIEGEAVALFFNPELRAARLRAGVTRAAAENAGLWQDPSLSFDGERIIENVKYPWIIGAMVGLTIPLSGSLEAEKLLAQGEHDTEIARVLADEWRVRLELRRAWLEWTAAAQRLHAAEDFTEHLDGLLNIIGRLEEAGELPRIESRLFHLEEARRRIERRDLESELQQKNLGLRRIMGLSPAAPLSFQPASLTSAAPPALSPEEEMLHLVNTNPAMRVARAEYEAAERTLQLEIRRQYPDLEIGLGGGSEEDEPRILFGLSIPLPIWNRNQRAVAEAQASRELSRVLFESHVEQLAHDLASARTRLAAAELRRQAIEQTVAPLADQQQADARRTAELGEVDTLLLLESVTKQYEAKRDLIEAALDESLASAAIIEILGPTPIRPEGTPHP